MNIKVIKNILIVIVFVIVIIISKLVIPIIKSELKDKTTHNQFENTSLCND